jgi:hypothetical protein
LLLLYITYQYCYDIGIVPNNSIYELVDLNKPPIEAILPNALTNPSSTRYAIGGWFYINSWNQTDYKFLITKTPFTTSSNSFSEVDSNVDFCLYLDKIQPNLIYQLTSLQPGIPIQPITIMSGFPLQKWTHVIISIDNQIIDAYINGKLVLSHKLEALPQNTNSGIFFGNNVPTDIRINSFQRWSVSMNPETAWKTYLHTKPKE